MREAIIAANAAPGTETIIFDIPATDPGYDAVANRYTITLTNVLPDLQSDMSINGLGAKSLTVRRDAAAATRFRIFSTIGTVSISGLTISQGSVSYHDPGGSQGGGGIVNFRQSDR